MTEDKKRLEKLNKNLSKFMANPRMGNFDAIVNEMDRLSPGKGLKEKAEELKRKRRLG